MLKCLKKIKIRRQSRNGPYKMLVLLAPKQKLSSDMVLLQKNILLLIQALIEKQGKC